MLCAVGSCHECCEYDTILITFHRNYMYFYFQYQKQTCLLTKIISYYLLSNKSTYFVSFKFLILKNLFNIHFLLKIYLEKKKYDFKRILSSFYDCILCFSMSSVLVINIVKSENCVWRNKRLQFEKRCASKFIFHLHYQCFLVTDENINNVTV